MTDNPSLRLTPPPFADDQALAAVWDALPQARVVGGAVRDAVARRPVADIDLATPLSPDRIIAALSAAGLRAVPTGLAHGTVTAISGGHGFEVTTLRRDVATDGRHALVEFTSDWQQDALRRDFTINAMSMTQDGDVFDYFEGLRDLREGVVRFVGDAAARIAEDYLRILRYFRFYARYGRTPPNPATLDALRSGVHGLRHLSVERIWAELERILAAPDPVRSINLMTALDILSEVAPELGAPERLETLRSLGAPADPILRLAAMLTGAPDHLADRLKLSNHDRDRLIRLTTVPTPRRGDDEATLRRLLADFDRADLTDRTWLAGDAAGDDLRQRIAAMAKPVFPLEGRDVLALGLSSGPIVGSLLRDLRTWWMAGGCVADYSACHAELVRQACAAR